MINPKIYIYFLLLILTSLLMKSKIVKTLKKKHLKVCPIIGPIPILIRDKNCL